MDSTAISPLLAGGLGVEAADDGGTGGGGG